jgi:hypothetical protein
VRRGGPGSGRCRASVRGSARTSRGRIRDVADATLPGASRHRKTLSSRRCGALLPHRGRKSPQQKACRGGMRTGSSTLSNLSHVSVEISASSSRIAGARGDLSPRVDGRPARGRPSVSWCRHSDTNSPPVPRVTLPSFSRHGSVALPCPFGARSAPPNAPGRLGHGHSLPGPWPRRPGLPGASFPHPPYTRRTIQVLGLPIYWWLSSNRDGSSRGGPDRAATVPGDRGGRRAGSTGQVDAKAQIRPYPDAG